MMTYPQHIDRDERIICNRLFKAALARPENLFLRVYDGEEWATDWTRDLSAIKPEVAATDETRIYLMAVSPTGAARRIGSVLLIHGNGEDVISDASWNSREADAEGIIDALCKAGTGEGQQ